MTRAAKPDLLAAAAALVAEGRFSPGALARQAGVALSEAAELGDEWAVIRAMIARADRAALAIRPDPADSPRDRLAEAILARFDSLTPFRPAVRRLARQRQLPPPRVIAAGAAGIGWTLAAAGLTPRHPLLGLGLAAGLPWLTAVWLEDAGEELPKTMAALDRLLDRLEPFLG